MNQVRVKFCGITNEADVHAAREAGADFIGFIFVDTSPRSVTLEQAVNLISHAGSMKTVGVFENSNAEHINHFADFLHLDYVQVYGALRDVDSANISTPVIRAFRGIPPLSVLEKVLDTFPHVLLDKDSDGVPLDLEKVSTLPVDVKNRLFLAGGLNSSNVGEAVRHVHPFAVDCARGVEIRPGQKNHKQMKQFVINATL